MTSAKSPTQLNSASGMMIADESLVQEANKPYPDRVRRYTECRGGCFEDEADDCETANYYCHYKPENIGCRLVLREIDNWKHQVRH